MSDEATPFQGSHLIWPFDRRGRPFEVRIVEPRDYEPGSHSEIFNAALTAMLAGPQTRIDSYTRSSAPRRRFDLLTFPEAFLPRETLLATLENMAIFGPSGCVHAGLRPTHVKADGHLFSATQLRVLVADIEKGVAGAAEDLAAFSGWLDLQAATDMFNVGAFFLNDAQGKTRICLHPKLVKSRFETSGLPEHHMMEADLLTLITLQATRQDLGSVTIQPLICSDALNLPTDREYGPPLAAVNKYAACFDPAPPNDVDLVSVATCTPQPEGASKARTFRAWNERFQETFLAAFRGPDYVRHRKAAFVLANFQEIEPGMPGGLSGIFLPLAPGEETPASDVAICCWGKPKDKSRANNIWSEPEDDALREWRSHAFIAQLEPDIGPDGAQGRLLAAAIARLPREITHDTNVKLTQMQVHKSLRDENDILIFADPESRS